MKTNSIHTPYDGSSKPFAIGLKPLELADWIIIDNELQRYLEEKDQLASTIPHKVIVSASGSLESQQEVLDLLSAHLISQFPQTYSLHENSISIVPLKREVPLSNEHIPPIHIAASLVQEDLVLMHKGALGWQLSAASLCFPSAWNLLEKFRKPIHEIHAPVPGFNAGTRNASLIERIFNNLQITQPAVRWNWSVYGDSELYHPVSDNGMKRRFGDADEPANIHFRLERQTLRKLPVSGDILFTIRIFIDPISALENHTDAANLAQSISAQLQAMDAEQISYKGLSGERERLINRLAEVSGLPKA